MLIDIHAFLFKKVRGSFLHRFVFIDRQDIKNLFLIENTGIIKIEVRILVNS